MIEKYVQKLSVAKNTAFTNWKVLMSGISQLEI
jgi:hypothetical protein